MPKPRRLLLLTSLFIVAVFIAQAPRSFTTTSQKTKVTITIHPNEDSDDQGDNDDQGEDDNNQGNQNLQQNFNLFNWLKSLFS